MRMQVILDSFFARPGSAPGYRRREERRVQGLDYSMARLVPFYIPLSFYGIFCLSGLFFRLGYNRHIQYGGLMHMITNLMMSCMWRQHTLLPAKKTSSRRAKWELSFRQFWSILITKETEKGKSIQHPTPTPCLVPRWGYEFQHTPEGWNLRM